jgi:DNA polymerase/3'-5' exonuclease PolX
MVETIVNPVSPLLAELVYQLRQLAALEPEPRKRQAYLKAGESLLENADKFNDMARQPSSKQAFKELPGIGDSISSKIEEFLMFGKITKLLELQQNATR